jgi:hypothetical protein
MDLTEQKPTEAHASKGFAGGNSQRLVQNPLVFERRLLIPGVHGRFGEGNPEESFNDRRSGFGGTEGRPARFGDEARSLPNDFGRRALCDERDEGGRKFSVFREASSGNVSRQERGTRPTGLPGKVGTVRWSRLGVTQVARVVLDLFALG